MTQDAGRRAQDAGRRAQDARRKQGTERGTRNTGFQAQGLKIITPCVLGLASGVFLHNFKYLY
jgi:hypothetical protein